MRRSSWVAAITTMAVLVGVIAFAAATARRDRAALVKEFGDENLARVRIAVRQIESELSDVRLHLAFAAKLIDAADTGTDQRRELEALVTVVRLYRTIVVLDTEGRARVVAVDPAVSGVVVAASLCGADTADGAARHRASLDGDLQPLGDPSSPWYRAFAAPLVREGAARGAVVILADQQETFDCLRLAAAQPDSKLLLIGPHGRAAPITDPGVAAALGGSEQGGSLSALVTAMQAGHSGVMRLTREQARSVGFLAADAVAAFAPIRTADAGHWSIAVLDSTAGLEAQENAIVDRMAMLAVVFAAALGALSVYLVVSSRRAIEVQERLRTAEEIVRVRERAEKILENVPVAVVALDHTGRISALNVASRERLAAARVGDSLDAAFPVAKAGAVDTLRALVERARSTGAVQALVAQPIALTGNGRVFAAHAVPLPSPLPDMTLLVVLEDVTELQALGSQLLRAEKLATVGVLAAGIAHEVGTPLGVVRGRTEMLASWLGPSHPQTRTTGVILEEIDRISRTIQQLLDFARVSQAEVAPVDLAPIASSVIDLLAFEARKRRVSLEVEIPEPMPRLSANVDQLRQVLVNLALNGLDACEPGGTVTLRARSGERSGLAVVEVEDNGAGIPDALKHRVFDPFFTTKKRGKGTGLGLSIAAQIVRNHGGEIDLGSAAGRGTRVTMTWPLAAAPEERNGTAERRANPRR